MEKSKKVKIILGLFYLLVVSSFLYFFLSKFTLEELTSYEFIKNNRDYFFELKESNLILLSIIFLSLTIFWVFMLGFGSPVGLMAGFIFGKWIGLFLVTLGCTIGATFLYAFGNYFLADLIKKKFLKKFKNLEVKIKKNEFTFFVLYRFVGGVPFPIANLLPAMFNVSLKSYFFGTLFGIIPSLFIIVSLGSGIEKIIKKNLVAPEISEIILSPDVYLPILGFVALIFISMIIKKLFYKD